MCAAEKHVPSPFKWPRVLFVLIFLCFFDPSTLWGMTEWMFRANLVRWIFVKFLVEFIISGVLCAAIHAAMNPTQMFSCCSSIASQQRLCHISGTHWPSATNVFNFAGLHTCTSNVSFDSVRFLLSILHQSLSDFVRSGSFQASAVLQGCMMDMDTQPSNQGPNSMVVPSGFPCTTRWSSRGSAPRFGPGVKPWFRLLAHGLPNGCCRHSG